MNVDLTKELPVLFSGQEERMARWMEVTGCSEADWLLDQMWNVLRDERGLQALRRKVRQCDQHALALLRVQRPDLRDVLEALGIDDV